MEEMKKMKEEILRLEGLVESGEITKEEFEKELITLQEAYVNSLNGDTGISEQALALKESLKSEEITEEEFEKALITLQEDYVNGKNNSNDSKELER